MLGKLKNKAFSCLIAGTSFCFFNPHLPDRIKIDGDQSSILLLTEKISVFFWILLPIFWSLIPNAFICCVIASCLWTMWEVNTSVAQWSDFQVVSQRSSVDVRQWRRGLGEKESHRAPVLSLTSVSDFFKSKMLLSFNRGTELRTS